MTNDGGPDKTAYIDISLIGTWLAPRNLGWKLAGSRSLLVILACHAALGMFTAFCYLGSQCYSASNFALKHRRIAIQQGLAQSSGFTLPLLFAQSAIFYGIAWPFKYAWLLPGNVRTRTGPFSSICEIPSESSCI